MNDMNERVGLYSMSLYSVACEENCAKEVYDSLVTVKQLIGDKEEYIKIISSANLTFYEREGLIDKAFEGNVHPLCLNFMKILAKKRIFNIFVACVDEYEKQYLNDNNIMRALITTAIELDDDRKKDIVDKIGKKTGKNIIARFKVDEDIVGGIIIETENSSIDASVSGKIEEIRRYISKN